MCIIGNGNGPGNMRHFLMAEEAFFHSVGIMKVCNPMIIYKLNCC
jgi:hypothetical protein